MINRPYSENVSDAQYTAPNNWWRNLSINQMKAFEAKHFPNRFSGTSYHMVHQMWEEEGRPEPQALIPVIDTKSE